jgi:3-oxoacyl-[acyl-carrier protein] reductase
MDLKGKVAFVTGGSGDIGGAIARALATAGADVAISYVGQLEAAAATVDALRAAGRQSLAVQLDQRDPTAIDASVDRVVGEFGRVDILVNNAAWNIGIPFTDLATLTADIWAVSWKRICVVRTCSREHSPRTCAPIGQVGS